MKKLMLVFLMGLLMSLLLSGCEETSSPVMSNGKPICWAEKYGVNFADCGDGIYIFSDGSHSESRPIAATLVAARKEFEKAHPGLRYLDGYAAGSYGQTITLTYVPRTASDSPTIVDPDVRVGDKVIGKLSEFSSLVSQPAAPDSVATE
ncbi:MAG: hypothetical protein LBD11_07330 [Candidatus Peribacteria bacterium]|jgi:hypothetical protein|nr:hypothetical protein [Candidatus Peribacteria bacterium]